MMMITERGRSDIMRDDDTRKPKHGGFVAAGLILPVFYVLSFGPVMKFTLPVDRLAVLRRVYLPVDWLHDHTILKKPLEEYAKLWGL